MKRFIEGLDRSQTTLLPECIDDYVDEDNPVRAVDAFVDMLDLAALGFDVEPEATGRPGYHPATLLKLYVYGYLNQVQSSRRLERECGRNLELIWLMGRLKPDFKTIADFRRDNGSAIRKVCRQFIALCRDIDLLDASLVAIDGSKFKAVNAKAKNYTREKLKRRLGEIDAAIDRYMGELDRTDEVLAKTGMHPVEARLSRIVKKLAHYRKEARTLRAIEQRMDSTGETQVSLTDPDCRAMATTSKQPRIVGYNVQSAVETKYHLIVAHEVTNHGYDRDALSMMAHKARDAMAGDKIEAIADAELLSRRCQRLVSHLIDTQRRASRLRSGVNERASVAPKAAAAMYIAGIVATPVSAVRVVAIMGVSPPKTPTPMLKATE
jgi:transposase